MIIHVSKSEGSSHRVDAVGGNEGVLQTSELRAAGLHWRDLGQLVAAGELRRYRRGLYYCPLRDPDLGRRWRQRARLELLAAGSRAMLARESAATMWQLDGFSPGPEAIELNVASSTGGGRSPSARRALAYNPATSIDGFPVTGIDQTLCELGSAPGRETTSPADQVEIAMECALHRQLTTFAALEEQVRDASGRHGISILRGVLSQRPPGIAPTESYLETRMVQLLRAQDLPAPQRQVELFDRSGLIGRVDLLVGHLVIELDGRAHHDNDPAFHRDRLRRARLEAAGYAVVEFTYRLVVDEAALVATIVRDTLARAA